MDIPDYTIDTTGNPAATPDAVKRRRALADQLMKTGMDSSPAAGGPGGGWVTALNRGLAGALSGYQRGSADQAEQQGQAGYQQKLAQALQGGGNVSPQSMIQLAGDPWANPAQLSTMTHVADAQRAQANSDRDFGEKKREFGMSYGLQKQSADRAAYEFDNTPDQYVPNPRASEPGQPAYIDQYAAAKTGTAPLSRPITPEERAAYKIAPSIPVMMTPDGPKTISGAEGNMFSPVAPEVSPAQPPQQQQLAPSIQQPSVSGQDVTPQGPQGANTQSPGQQPAAQSGQAAQPAATVDPTALDPTTGRREGFLKTLNPQAQDYIKKVADYEIDPRTTSIRGGEREKLMSAVAHYDPAYNQNDFSARAKAIKDFSTGPQGNMIRSFDVAIDHLGTLQKAAIAMQNGDYRTINMLRNKWREETGNDLPTTYEALKPLVSGEIAKAAIGSGNALSDREELRQPLNAAGSPNQLLAPIQAYKSLMAGQLRGLKKQYQDTTGKKDFDARLRDETKQQLEPPPNSNKTVIDGYTITEH